MSGKSSTFVPVYDITMTKPLNMKYLFTTFLVLMTALSLSASKVDWYLFLWSDTYSLDGDAGQFETTDNASVFTLKACTIPASGINIGVHNASWSTIYGWSDTGGVIAAQATPYQLAPANAANGWSTLPAGTYDVTFDLSVPSLRFDTVAESEEEDPELKPASSLRGGDLTMVTYLEDWGAKFYYHDGAAADVFDILSSYGINLARLRLYNAPGTAVKNGDMTYRMPITTTKHPSGFPYAGPEDILSLAQRAKAHEMAICLTIYLSDYWSGATEQYIPGAWANVSDLNTLGDSVYNFVYAFMTRMVEQGTAPEYVSVGNESDYGILYQNLNKSYVSFGGHTTRNGFSNAVFLFNKAYDAIKAVSPSSQVIIHHTGGDQGRAHVCKSFFSNFISNGGKVDIVGGSYYPRWSADHGSTDDTPTGMLQWAKSMEESFHKPVMIMETGYSWNPYKCPGRNGGNWEGQLGLNGSYNEASEAGQEAFMKDLQNAINTDQNIVGYMYWDPIFVDQYVNGAWIKTCWAEKYSGSGTTWWEDGNVISNTTLFDFTGRPLSARWREINSRNDKPISTGMKPTPFPSGEDRGEAYKVLRNGQLLILRGNNTYTLTGQKIK